MMETNNSAVRYVLVGSYTDHEYGYGGWTGRHEYREENVATFDTRKMAEDYIKRARLKNPKDRERPFRSSSLLVNFESAHVEEYYPETLPHNPVL